jgi:hypothetical protein
MDEFLPKELRAPTMARWLNLTNYDGRDVVVNLSKVHSIEIYEDDAQHPQYPYAHCRIDTSHQTWYVREEIAYIKRLLGVE